MEISVYTPTYEYSAGLIFVENKSALDDSYWKNNEYEYLGTFEEFRKTIENEINGSTINEVDYSWIE